MKILFTCGGTAGHINPALALARLFRERKPETEILFVGARGGMEEDLVPKAGFAIESITISAFRRRMSMKGLRDNLHTLKNLKTARHEAEKILDRFPADLVMGTGGYASYPLVREAARRGIPTAIHESNAVPGLTSKRLSAYADCVMLGFPGGEEHYKHPERVCVTGTPVRPGFFELTRREAKRALGLPEDQPLLLSYWGSLGAWRMNEQMLAFIIKECQEAPPFSHIHGAGGNYAVTAEGLEEQGVHLPDHIRLLEYIHNMPQVMAAADLVLCRGGASTLSELGALGRAAIIVPSPNVTNDHQGKNAARLADCGAALVIAEADCNADRLYEETSHLLTENAKRMGLERAMAEQGLPDAAEQIYKRLLKLLQKG